MPLLTVPGAAATAACEVPPLAYDGFSLAANAETRELALVKGAGKVAEAEVVSRGEARGEGGGSEKPDGEEADVLVCGEGMEKRCVEAGRVGGGGGFCSRSIASVCVCSTYEEQEGRRQRGEGESARL